MPEDASGFETGEKAQLCEGDCDVPLQASSETAVAPEDASTSPTDEPPKLPAPEVPSPETQAQSIPVVAETALRAAEEVKDGSRAVTQASSSAPVGPSTGGPAVSGVSAPRTGPSEVGARSQPTMKERMEALKKLEAENREAAANRATVEGKLAAARAHCKNLETRWADISGVSDDALQHAEEARQQVAALRRALKVKDGRIAEAEEACQRLTLEKESVELKRRDLEANFQKSLEREVSQKEQELF